MPLKIVVWFARPVVFVLSHTPGHLKDSTLPFHPGAESCVLYPRPIGAAFPFAPQGAVGRGGRALAADRHLAEIYPDRVGSRPPLVHGDPRQPGIRAGFRSLPSGSSIRCLDELGKGRDTAARFGRVQRAVGAPADPGADAADRSGGPALAKLVDQPAPLRTPAAVYVAMPSGLLGCRPIDAQRVHGAEYRGGGS